MSQIGNSIETENRLVAVRGWGNMVIDCQWDEEVKMIVVMLAHLLLIYWTPLNRGFQLGELYGMLITAQ